MARPRPSRPWPGATARRPPAAVTLRYGAHGTLVGFEDALDVADHLHRTLRGWVVAPADAAEDAAVAVSGGLDGFTVRSPWLDEPITGLTSVAAACCVVADLAECLLDASPDLLCLHCGAAEIGGRLVALTGPSHMGKSTLAARLSMEDVVLYCDDMLPIDREGHGIALGVGPRLRLPLPAAASPAFAAHVAAHRGPSDGRYAYVNAPSVASHGRRAPIGAVLLLDRRRAAPPACARPRRPRRSPSSSARTSSRPAAGRDRRPLRRAARRGALPAPRVCRPRRGRFAHHAQLRALADRRPDCAASRAGKRRRPGGRAAAGRSDRHPLHPPARRRNAAGRRRHLSDRRCHPTHPPPERDRGIVWSLLADPMTGTDLAEALRILYPGVPGDRLEADLAALLAALRADRLIEVERQP
jgi:hypothetical protein